MVQVHMMTGMSIGAMSVSVVSYSFLMHYHLQFLICKVRVHNVPLLPYIAMHECYDVIIMWLAYQY